MPTKNVKSLELLNSIQNTYLVANKETPIVLFDEINGYTQTLNAMSLVTQNYGPDGLYSNGERNIVLLPLFLVYGVNYLSYVKENSPENYKKLLMKKSLNQLNFKLLFQNAEKAYLDWQKVNSCSKCVANDFEDNLWKDYLKKKKYLPL